MQIVTKYTESPWRFVITDGGMSNGPVGFVCDECAVAKKYYRSGLFNMFLHERTFLPIINYEIGDTFDCYFCHHACEVKCTAPPK